MGCIQLHVPTDLEMTCLTGTWKQEQCGIKERDQGHVEGLGSHQNIDGG